MKNRQELFEVNLILWDEIYLTAALILISLPKDDLMSGIAHIQPTANECNEKLLSLI